MLCPRISEYLGENHIKLGSLSGRKFINISYRYCLLLRHPIYFHFLREYRLLLPILTQRILIEINWENYHCKFNLYTIMFLRI